jgi:hypothetical protein
MHARRSDASYPPLARSEGNSFVLRTDVKDDDDPSDSAAAAPSSSIAATTSAASAIGVVRIMATISIKG